MVLFEWIVEFLAAAAFAGACPVSLRAEKREMAIFPFHSLLIENANGLLKDGNDNLM